MKETACLIQVLGQAPEALYLIWKQYLTTLGIVERGDEKQHQSALAFIFDRWVSASQM